MHKSGTYCVVMCFRLVTKLEIGTYVNIFSAVSVPAPVYIYTFILKLSIFWSNILVSYLFKMEQNKDEKPVIKR